MRRLFTIFCVFVFFGASAQNFNHEAIADELMNQLAEKPGEKIPFFIMLQDQVDVLSMKDDFKARRVTKDQRSFELITALQNKAANTQGPILEYLRSSTNIQTQSVQSYWVVNVVYAVGNAQAIAELSRRNDVLLMEPIYDKVKGEHTINECVAPPSLNGRENGHTAIKANKLWEQGYTGYGTLTMTIDTGVDGDHRSLRNNWRGLYYPDQGYTGTGSEPTDCDGHGSHVTGSICGLNRVENDTIGVAFNSQWIGSPLDLIDGCSDVGLNSITSFQYALNPDGDASTSNDIPIAVNCSWGTNAECWNGTQLAQTMNALETAGIAVVWSAGNDGPGAMTNNSNASISLSEVNSFSIGNLNGNNPNYPINSSSSRGPSLCGGNGSILIKPEVSAPGTQIRSCSGGGGFMTITGTSMSAPHVTGAIALLSEKFPDAIGEDIKYALYNTCTDLGAVGEDNDYGMGIIDLVAASDYLLAQNFAMSNPVVTTDVIGVNMDFATLNCNGVFNGTIEFENAGTANLTTVDMNYTLSSGSTVVANGTWNWTGNIAQNERIVYTIPETTAADGLFTLEVDFVNPNNTADEHPLNNKLTKVLTISGEEALVPVIIGEVNPCSGSSALLTLDLEGAKEIEWYFNANATNPLGTGNTFLTPGLAGAFTFYVDAIFEKNGGITEFDASNSEYTDGSGNGLVFDVFTPLTLKSVKVYSEGSGPKQISLRTSTNAQLEFKTLLLPSSGEHTIELDWDIEAGIDYRLVLTTGNGLAHTNAPSFPYVLPGAMSIKSGLSNDDPQGKYHYFYDWNVEYKFACGRQPINMSFESTDNTPAASFDYTANPSGVSFNNTSTNGATYLWSFGDGSTSDMENPVYSYAAIGTYSVALTTINEAGCSDTEVMDVQVDEVTAITELEASNQIKVFPNPTKNRLNVQFEFAETQNVNFSVIDLLGRTLERHQKRTYLNDQLEINLNNYAEGIYHLVFEIDGIKVVKKVVKMK